jgi:ubiquinone/menaquinone biosynthesis C-methylase UbiE
VLELSSNVLFVARTLANLESKDQVAAFWNSEPCGTRYFTGKSDFDTQAEVRYQLEPHIPEFAGFSSASGRRVLEVGIGIGADYEQWLRAGARATGVDLSTVSLAFARRRCEFGGFRADLRQADAENLPFATNSFDVVYSYGVMHHSPDTAKCINEAWRVLKPGGEARIMIYHHASITGFLLWLRYGLWDRQSIRDCVYSRLESPGTKTFTRDETFSLMQRFENVRIEQVFSPGDLLLHKPSLRFCGVAYQVLRRLFPRKLVRKFGRRWALFLLISGTKPRTNTHMNTQ